MMSSKLMWSRLTVKPVLLTMATAARSIRCSVSWSDRRRPRRARPVGVSVPLFIPPHPLVIRDFRLYVSSFVSHILTRDGTTDENGPGRELDRGDAGRDGGHDDKLAVQCRRAPGHVRRRPGQRDR